MTGAQFTDFVLHTHGLGPISAEPRYAQIVDRLNVREHLSTRFGEASLGTRKKFFLLAALLLETEVLIMDEPFNGIDHATTLALIELLNQIAPNNTILLTCHLPQIIEAIHGVRWHLGRSPHTRITRDVSGHAFA
jgi:ABC-2 type transport system ATP-binding protein